MNPDAEELALRRAIAWSPLDLTPRMVLADWLMEQDDPKTQRRGQSLANALSDLEGGLRPWLTIPSPGIPSPGIPRVKYHGWWGGFPMLWCVDGPLSHTIPQIDEHFQTWPIHQIRSEDFQPTMVAYEFTLMSGQWCGWLRFPLRDYPGIASVPYGYWRRLRPHVARELFALYRDEDAAYADLGHAIVHAGRERAEMPEVVFPTCAAWKPTA